jgi:hypothetical protein
MKEFGQYSIYEVNHDNSDLLVYDTVGLFVLHPEVAADMSL